LATQALVAVHGMGQDTADSFKEEIRAALEAAVDSYPSHSWGDVKTQFDIIPIAYNDIFDEYRERMADRGRSVRDRLNSLPGTSNVAVTVVNEIEEIEAEIDDDDFFKTHFLDVIFYRYTVLGEPVRIRAGRHIADAVREYGSANVHLLGYSLGSAVLHDTLTKLYGPMQFTADGRARNLDANTHYLASIYMVANVSRLLESSWAHVKTSVVRPGELGIAAQFQEFRHKLDPFTWPKAFDPTNNGEWISQTDWSLNAYRLFEPTEVTAANTHSLTHYLKNPAVHLPLLANLVRFRPRVADKKAAMDEYLKATALGKAQALEDTFENLNVTDPSSVMTFVKTAKAFIAFVKSFGENF